MRRWLCLVIIVLLMLFPLVTEARSHRFLNLNIDAQVGADGVVRITETHTVQFDGTFSGMFQWIDASRGVEIRDLVVLENGIPYTRLDTDTPGEAGTYFVREEANRVFADWSFSATDEIRRFELSYSLHNVILRHNDVAEFYYKFVGDQWDQHRDHVRIVLSLPHGAELDEVAAWGHGPLNGQVLIESASQIIWEVENLPAKTFVEGRVVFPNSLVPLATRQTNEDRLEAIFREESGIQASQERRQKRIAIDPYAAVAMVVLVYLLGVYIWHRYGKSRQGYKERYYRELPAKYPPAELAILYRRAVDSRDFTATLLDLARRGFLTIAEIQEDDANYKFTKQTVSPEQTKSLRTYETRILKLFAELGNEVVTLEDFKQYAKDNKKAFAEFWKEWGKDVQEAAKAHHFFDQEAKKAFWFMIPVVGLFVALGIFASWGMVITAVACAVLGFVLIILVTVVASRHSDHGYEQYTKWRAFRRYLKEFSRVEMTRVGSLGIWEEFLPYAITLGVANQMLKQLEVRFPNLEQDGYQFGSYWFLYHRPMGMVRISRMTDTVNKSLSSLTATHGSGTGGGFSGGGGGGFGGGGGGVR